MGQSEWPDNYVTSANATENEKERSRILGGGAGESVECDDADEGTSEGSFGVVSSAARDGSKGHFKMMNVITDTFAKKLRLRDVPDHGHRIDIQGISEGKVSTTRRACVKITLGLEKGYEFEMWVMAHRAGVDVLGFGWTCFTARRNCRTKAKFHKKRQIRLEEHVLWVRRTDKLIPSVARFRRGRPQSIRVTNVYDQTVYLPAHDSIAMWIPDGDLPRGGGYVRLDSQKYQNWQVLAYEGCRDRKLFQRECEIYEQWLATQPSAVERPDYPQPRGVLARPFEDLQMDSDYRRTCAERWAMIMEERELAKACLASGVTAGNLADGQFSETPSDTYTAAHGEANNANEASVARTHERLSSVKVVHTPTSVRFESGTGSDGDTSLYDIVPGLHAAEFANESSVVGAEYADVVLKVVNTAPSVRCEIGANAGLSRQRSSEELSRSQQPNMSAACAFNIANKDSAGGPAIGNQAKKGMDPVPRAQIEADADVALREESVATLDETFMSGARVLTAEGNKATEDTRSDFCEHPANNIGLEDNAKGLAFLPYRRTNTTIDYNAPNVADPKLSTDR
ncbi:hypothetical protein PInf_021030 [Phytophthora infestans]|nr:hypothetical protein PInf_021030 [Phytophthora infestans]